MFSLDVESRVELIPFFPELSSSVLPFLLSVSVLKSCTLTNVYLFSFLFFFWNERWTTMADTIEDSKLKLAKLEGKAEHLEKELATLQTKHEGEIERRKDAENKLRDLEDENCKLWSIVIVRYQIEDLDERMDEILSFPSKETMLDALKSHPLWVCKLENPNYRYVKFFYFITSNETLAHEVRNIIIRANISIHDFCRLVVKIFKRASFCIHRPARTLTIEEIKEGLKFYGLGQTEILECVDILESIHNLSVRRSTTSVQQSAPSSFASSDTSMLSQPSQFFHYYPSQGSMSRYSSEGSFRQPRSFRQSGSARYRPYLKQRGEFVWKGKRR